MRLFQSELLLYKKNWDSWKSVSLNPQWTRQNSSWQDIKYSSNAGFVVVGSEGKITQSDDGVTFQTPWKPKHNGISITDEISGIGLSNNSIDNRIVNTIININHSVYATNNNLKAFNYSFSTNNASFKTSEYGNGIFVTVGNPNEILLTNEIMYGGEVSFTEYTNELTYPDVNKLKYIKQLSKFYIVSSPLYRGTMIWSSSDGIEWEHTITPDKDISWEDIIYFRKNNYHAILLVGYSVGKTYISYCEGSTSTTPYIFSQWSEPICVSMEFSGKCGLIINDKIMICGTNGRILTSPKINNSQDLYNLFENRNLWNVESTRNNEDWKGIATNDEKVVIIGKNNIAYKNIEDII